MNIFKRNKLSGYEKMIKNKESQETEKDNTAVSTEEHENYDVTRSLLKGSKVEYVEGGAIPNMDEYGELKYVEVPTENIINEKIVPDTDKQESLKFDKGKVQLSLLPTDSLIGIAKVLMFGKDKYGANSWKNITDTDRYYDALLRHLFAWRDGEQKDTDSGLHHLLHAGANIVFLIHFMLRGKLK